MAATKRFLQMLRESGVREYRETEHGIHVRFYPPAAPPAEELVEATPTATQPNLRGIQAEGARASIDDEQMTEEADLGLPGFPERPDGWRAT